MYILDERRVWHLRKITWSLQDFVAELALLVDIHRGSILLATGHGPFNSLVNRFNTQGALEGWDGVLVVWLSRL